MHSTVGLSTTTGLHPNFFALNGAFCGWPGLGCTPMTFSVPLTLAASFSWQFTESSLCSISGGGGGVYGEARHEGYAPPTHFFASWVLPPCDA